MGGTITDGLSWQLSSKNNPVEKDDFKDWIDNAYLFVISLMNMCTSLAVGTADHHRHTTHGSEMPLCTLSVLISTTLDTLQTDPTIPHSHKAIAKESCIDHIHNFLNTHICLTDLSNADYKSFINAATRSFILNNALYHREPHGCHQLVIPIAHCYGLIWEAHDSLGYKGVFFICSFNFGGQCWLTHLQNTVFPTECHSTTGLTVATFENITF